MIGIGIGSGSGGGGSGSVSPIGASLDLIFRDPLGVEFGAPRTIAGTTTVAGWPNLGTFTRASTADWINVAGDGLETQAANNVLRRGPVRGALFEQGVTAQPVNSTLARTNDTSLPFLWNYSQSANGLTRTVSYETTNGIPVCVVRIQGTATATLPFGINFSAATGAGSIAASQGQSWSGSAFANCTSDPALSSLTLRIVERAAGVGQGTQGSTNIPLGATLTRISVPYTVTVVSTDAIQLFMQTNNIAAGSTVDFTIRIGLPMLNLGTLTSPILTTDSGAVTRAADVLSVPVSLAGDFTAVVVARRPVTATNATDTLLNLSVDASNRIGIRRNTGGNLVANAIVAGSETGSASVTEPSSGARFAVAIRRSGTDIGISLNGGAPVNDTPSSLPGTKVALNVGSNAAGTAQWTDYIERVIVFPTAASDATLQSYSTLATWGA